MSSAFRHSTSLSPMLSKKGTKPTRSASLNSIQTSRKAALEQASVENNIPPGTPAVQRLYLLLPNHKCPNKKLCPFHPPEEGEDVAEEGEILYRNKRRTIRSRSLVRREEISDNLLEKKLAKINEDISSSLVQNQKLHFPEKIRPAMSTVKEEPDALPNDNDNIITVAAPTSVTQKSVTQKGVSLSKADSKVVKPTCGINKEEGRHPVQQVDTPAPPDLRQAVSKGGQKNVTVVAPTSKPSTGVDGELTLQVAELSVVDARTATFQATNGDGGVETGVDVVIGDVRSKAKKVKESEATLKQIRPAHAYDTSLKDTNIPPQFTLPLANQSRAVGEEVTFTVTVTCRPEPEIIWFQGNRKLAKSSRLIFQHSKGVHRMTILNLNLLDAGEYRCHAINAYGENWCHCDLKVIDRSNRHKTIQ